MTDAVVGVVLGSIMLVAGLGKLLQGEGFRHTLDQYARVFGWPTTLRLWSFLAQSLPWLQILVGAMLLRGLLVRPSAALVGLMLAAFVGIQLGALRTGRKLECGCFGL